MFKLLFSILVAYATLPYALGACAPNTSCITCTKDNTCGFSPITLKCIAKATGGPAVAGLVTSANPQLCPPLQQLADVTAATSPALNAQAQDRLAAMSNHIFMGEPTSATSGRHTFTSWTAVNRDAGRCDNEVHLCAFQLNNRTPKTVWDDRPDTYTRSDIETMCLIAIKLNLAESRGTRDGAFVVQNRFAHPVCVQHQIAGTGSCFPLGIHATASRLGQACVSSGNNAVAGKTVEVPPR